MNKDLPSPELLRKLLRYEPDTGKLFWRHRPEGPNNWNARFSNKEAFTAFNCNGYKIGSVRSKPQLAHRVIWTIVHGVWPVGDVDHINGLRTDNRLINLRNVSKSINQRNAKMKSSNTSGHNGVHWYARAGKWKAEITLDWSKKHLGYFDDIADAIAARNAAEAGHGFTERHGQ